MFEDIGFESAPAPEGAKLVLGIHLLEEGKMTLEVVDSAVKALGPENFSNVLETAIVRLQRLHRYVELGIMLPALVQNFGNEPKEPEA